MRHGIAEPPHGSDFGRNLTPRGIKGVKESVVELSGRQFIPWTIFTSPLVRARQTAELVRTELELSQPIEILDEITPDADPEKVIGRLSVDVEKELCLLVSHQPFVSIFIKYLTNIDVFMETANIACISMDVFEPNCGDLEWLIPG